jgi:hypothetical protein
MHIDDTAPAAPEPATRVARTGPIGRTARLLLAAAASGAFASIADQGGPVGFRNPSVLAEVSVWVLHAIMLALFVVLVGALATAIAGQGAARRWQRAALGGLLATLAVAGLIGHVAHGAAWGFPLADLVWWFDALMLVETIVALLLAVALGTPGCEIGVWPALIARARGRTAEPASWVVCLVAVDLLDEWEARRRAGTRRG